LNGLIFPMCHHFSIWSSRASLLMSVRVRNGDMVCLWASTHHITSLVCICLFTGVWSDAIDSCVCYHGNCVCMCAHA